MLHRLGGPILLQPRLTDTDQESPVFRIARWTQCCFARVRPEAAWPSLPFDCCWLTIDFFLDWFKDSINLELELELKLQLCHLTNRFSVQWSSTTPTLQFQPISTPKATLKFVTYSVNLCRQPIGQFCLNFYGLFEPIQIMLRLLVLMCLFPSLSSHFKGCSSCSSRPDLDHPV